MDKKKAKKLLIVGIICLVVSGILFLVGSNTNQQNLDIAKNGTNAYDVARQISQNNQSDVLINVVRMALLGFGGVLTIFSAFALLKK